MEENNNPSFQQSIHPEYRKLVAQFDRMLPKQDQAERLLPTIAGAPVNQRFGDRYTWAIPSCCSTGLFGQSCCCRLRRDRAFILDPRETESIGSPDKSTLAAAVSSRAGLSLLQKRLGLPIPILRCN